MGRVPACQPPHAPLLRVIAALVAVGALASACGGPSPSAVSIAGCRPDDITARGAAWDVGLGKATTTVTLTASDGVTCRIATGVGIALVSSSDKTIAEAPPSASDRTIELSPQSAGTVEIAWGNWCGESSGVPSVRLQIPQTGWVTITFPPDQADFTPGCGDRLHGIALAVMSGVTQTVRASSSRGQEVT
jgi:hypothetical protein